ncbi:MAG: N-acetylmuramoyl-L-alanine amidase [Akkermansia sp.]|nr:N-acetylmuramoyl-L-alanine amidase [Akkermansia sp.]
MRRLASHMVMMLLALFMCQWGGVYAQNTWDVTSIEDVEYVKLSDVWRFYRFTPKKGRPGCVSYGSGKHVVSLKPEKQDFYVNNYRYVLSHPVRKVGSDLMISSVDMRKLVDPVLRPRYSPDRKLRTVVIDPGHGGHDAGAVSSIAKEKDLNLAVARKLRKLLQRQGYRVVMTRDGDYFLTLQQRVDIANRIPDSIFVSIHHNAGRSAASGIETFTLAPQGTTSPFARSRRFDELAGNNQDSENIALATAVHSRAIRSSGAIDRGIQRARFSVLCTIRRPAILFEGGFVSNPAECSRMATSSYQNLLADSICKGIMAYNNTVCRPAQNVASTTPRPGRVRTSISGSSISNYAKRER